MQLRRLALEMPGVLAIPSKALRFKPNEAMLNDGETITDVEMSRKNRA